MRRSSSSQAPLHPAVSRSIGSQAGRGARAPRGGHASLDLDGLQKLSRQEKDALRASLDCLLAPALLKTEAKPLGVCQSIDSLHAPSGLISAFAGQPAFKTSSTPPAFESRLSRRSVSAVGMRSSASALPNMQAELVALGRFEGPRGSPSDSTSLRPSVSCNLGSISWPVQDRKE